jgi:hypothetical protein
VMRADRATSYRRIGGVARSIGGCEDVVGLAALTLPWS